MDDHLISGPEKRTRFERDLDARVSELEFAGREPYDIKYGEGEWRKRRPKQTIPIIPDQRPWEITLNGDGTLNVGIGNVFYWMHRPLHGPNFWGCGFIHCGDPHFDSVEYDEQETAFVYLVITRDPSSPYDGVDGPLDDISLEIHYGYVELEGISGPDPTAWNKWYYLLGIVNGNHVSQYIYEDIYIREDPPPGTIVMADLSEDDDDWPGWENITPSTPAYLMAGDGTPQEFDHNGDGIVEPIVTVKYKLYKKL